MSAGKRIVKPASVTLRDYFAAAALQGLLANPKLAKEILANGGARGGWIERSALAWADSMLSLRNVVSP